jgi:digeranylgeranylglycerophospholipid reductase
MLVGDAAHQVNPMTGGGIVSGMKGGWLAGKVAANAVAKGDYSEKTLEDYPDKLRKDFGKNHERFYKIKEATAALTMDELNSIAENVLKIPHDKRTLASVFKAAVFKKPSLIIDVFKVLSGV